MLKIEIILNKMEINKWILDEMRAKDRLIQTESAYFWTQLVIKKGYPSNNGQLLNISFLDL